MNGQLQTGTKEGGPNLQRTPCPRCHNEEFVVVFHGKDHLHGTPGRFTVVACAECGLWHQNPRPTRASLAQLYPDDYVPHQRPTGRTPVSIGTLRFLRAHLGYGHLPEPGRPSAKERVSAVARRWSARTNLIPDFVPGGALLEVGCGAGERLRLLAQLGWQTERMRGIELVPAAAAVARSGGIRIDEEAAEDVLPRIESGSLDVVVSSMVIEHLHDPFKMIKEFARVLRPGGQLLLSTVNRSSWDARWWGPYWRNLDLPRHMVWFSKEDLRRMVEPYFERLNLYYQLAPIDFSGSAALRARDRPRTVDRLILGLNPLGTRLLGAAAAAVGQSSRVSLSCYRQGGNHVRPRD